MSKPAVNRSAGPSPARCVPAMLGLTLLEVLIVLAIVALLATIALPSYRDYIERSRRSDAMIALQRVAAAQEYFYFDNNRYGTDLTSIGVSATSPDGYYTLTLTSASPNSFIARASPAAGSPQSGSGAFELWSTGARGWDPGEDGTYECDWRDAVRAGDGC